MRLIQFSTIGEEVVSRGEPVQRHSKERMSQAVKFKKAKGVAVLHIKDLLLNLVERINARGGAFFISTNKDVLIAQCGEINAELHLNEMDELVLFTGKTIIEKERYIQPVKSDDAVIGYLSIAIPHYKCTDLVEELIDAYSAIISRELHIVDKQATLEEYSNSLLRKKKELEQTQQYNTNLLNITTHDIASPLNAVSGYLDMMNECLQKDGNCSKIQDYHKRIRSGIEDISEMLQQLSEITKIERGIVSLDFVKVDLNWLAGEVCELLKSNAHAKDIALEIEYTDHPIYVEADVLKLKRVIYNLVTNALKYTRESGCIKVTAVKKDGRALLQIKDNGIGIPQSKISHIFEPYVKVNAEETETSSSGLGLYISSYFTTLMAGDIEVDSTPGEGSTFTINLPLIEGNLIGKIQAR